MNTDLIAQTAGKAFEGTIPFPEVVGQLMAAGVEYYLVDYARRRQIFYGADGASVEATIPFHDLPPVSADFAAADLRANILDSQTKDQKFEAFSRRAMQAGVQGYYAFLRGKRVTYIGRQGDQHTEWFPGAGPLIQDAAQS
jgi:uncharacterized protein YbcV (DUF1398 family)